MRPGTVTLNKQVVDYTPTDDGVTVTFADGSTEQGDFLIIADGTHSKLRNKICGSNVERKYVGYINFNAAVPQAAVKVRYSVIWKREPVGLTRDTSIYRAR